MLATSTPVHGQHPEYIDYGSWLPPERKALIGPGRLLACATDWKLISIVEHFDKGKRKCFAGNEWLANALTCSVRNVAYRVKELVGNGCLKRTFVAGRRQLTIGPALLSECRALHAQSAEHCTLTKQVTNKAPNTPSDSGSCGAGASDQPGATAVGLWTDADTNLTRHQRSKTANAKYTPTKFETMLAETLRVSLAKAQKINRRHSAKAEARHFHLLLNDVDQDRGRVMDALDWYCQHAGTPYMPVIHSARAFREKFPKVEAAILRSAEKANSKFNNPVPPAPQPPSPRVKAVLVKVDNYRWPKGANAKLPQFVAACIANVDELAQKTAILTKQMQGREYRLQGALIKLKTFHDRVCGTVNRGDAYVTEYCLEVFHRVTDWDAWSGDLDYFILRYDPTADPSPKGKKKLKPLNAMIWEAAVTQCGNDMDAARLVADYHRMLQGAK